MAIFPKSKLKLLFVQALLFLLFGEVVTRIFYPLPKQDNTIHYGTIAPNSEFGWLPKEHYSFDASIPNSAGIEYEVNYRSYQHGFREFGNTSSDSARKVLFIGDSFTQAAEVSNSKPFYNVINDSLGYEIFAFGASGFGTFQEFLVFKKFYELIAPDLIVWQLCTNDFIDNHYQLETQCRYKNQKKRPYYSNSSIEYHSSEETIKNLFIQHSALFYNLNKLYNKITKKLNINKPGEILIGEKGREYFHFNEAYEITDEIIKLIKAEVKASAQIVMFCADYYQPQFDFMRELVAANGILFIEDNIHRLNEAKSKGEIVFCYDNVHWNEKGHQIVGNALLSALRRNELVD